MSSSVCEECGRPFELVIPTQTICTQCMIRPQKKDLLVTSKEEAMPDRKHYRFKEKVCTHPGCGKTFQPTGACQKNCPEHLWKNVKGKSGGSTAKSETASSRRVKIFPVEKTAPGIVRGMDLSEFFTGLAGCGCTAMVFGNVKISIEKVDA